jgi:predicted RecB family nuclease
LVEVRSLMFFATNIADFLACHHLTTLEQAAAAGEIEREHYDDPGLELLRTLGMKHEQAYLRELELQGLRVVQIPTDIAWVEGAALTREAMVRGADAIYQATFIDGDWGGRADFVSRVATPSDLGDWSYEAIETKLARSTKARALIQLCLYSDLITKIQGCEPRWMHVVLGRGASPEKFRVQHYLAYFRKIRRDFQRAITAKPETYPEPVEHCYVCSWFRHCDEQWHSEDHLSLVAGITRNQRKALVGRGVNTVAALGRLQLPVVPKIERVAEAPLRRVREQARVQVRGREERRPVHEFLEPGEPGKGLAMLPLPSAGDIFLDFEGDPFAFDQGLEYLIGTVTVSPDDEPDYQTIWSFDRATEKKSFQTFINTIKQRRAEHPDMHIYHYAAYEPTAIKHLAGRHGICTDDVDELLRAEVFVDLFRVVRQGIRASVESYSIKKMEPFYGFTRTVPLRDATAALQAFETVLALDGNAEEANEILRTIEQYNRDDCVSAWRLREWLEGLRRELEASSENALPRPELKSGQPTEELAARITEATVLKERLTSGIPDEETERTNEEQAGWLLAQMLEWHRREDKSAWWEYYRLCNLSDDELIEDKNSLGGLVYVGVIDETKHSLIHRYEFPPQEHAIDRAHDVRDPRTRKGAGTVVNIDERRRTIDLKRGKASQAPHPTALVPCDVMDNTVLVNSLMRLGAWVADHGIDGAGPYRAARDILLRHPPRLSEGNLESLPEDLAPVEAAKKLVLLLDSSALPIQGPPGSGKTYAAAQMILALLDSGRRVGVTANSHKVISNLLSELCKAAEKVGADLRIVQKSNEYDGCDHDCVEQVDSNQAVLENLNSGESQVAAGTAWLWSREEMANSVDVLFVDEAGQMSLANVLAISQAANSVVLVGDPQQLDQPQKGVHPPGAELSALSHLLNGKPTIDRNQGLFLGETWRLPPDICAFTSEVFYDARLTTRPENEKQRLNSQTSLDGTGLRFIAIEHTGNQNESPEEAATIAELINQLLTAGTTWTDKDGKIQELRLNNVLVVAPYNAQVSALEEVLPEGVKVGTVDKFQGQQAPVVFYSMTTSTPEDAPRGMEFLYSSNRLNVATSRAQCLTVLVASPALFEVQCKTPRHMGLANPFCRYLEMAEVV